MLQNRRRLALALFFVLATSRLAGQVVAAPFPAEEESVTDSFGLGNQDLWVAASEFHSALPAFPFELVAPGYWVALNGGVAHKSLTLPAGARIGVITCYFYDNDADDEAIVHLLKYTYNTSTDTPGVSVISPEIRSENTGGFHRVFESYDETVRYRPSLFTRQSYTLEVILPASGEVRFRGCNVTWNRQVSPAPGAATFSDVPTSHPYFQFVEALVDAGITGGCGGGLYCVSAPITRGEMAVFLAAALGLHFPN